VRTRENRTLVDGDGNPIVAANVAETLAQVRPTFDLCFIVSNQARVGRGEISEAEVRRRFAWLNARLGHPFDDWRWCPHGDADGCGCRKPQPGMFLDLAAAYALNLGRSTHVGDAAKDREAAAAAGVGSFVLAREFFGWDRR
jgi:histidinol-phosphate phosphatase family protein